jgi:hypothetical protein
LDAKARRQATQERSRPSLKPPDRRDRRVGHFRLALLGI